MTKIVKAINKTINECLGVTNNDSFLILVDQQTRNLGYHFYKHALRTKAETAIIEISTKNETMPNPDSMIFQMIQRASVLLVFAHPTLIHSNGLKNACHNGTRILCINVRYEEIINRTINTDYEFIEGKSKRIADLLSIGRSIHVTTAKGTDLTIPIKRHKALANTGIVNNPGEYDTLPSGEATITPDKRGANGILVMTGSIPGIGLVRNPITLKIKDGYAYKIMGGEQVEQLRKFLKPFGKESRNIAEFGIGTNPDALLTGKTIEDEKVLGTAHIALGSPDFEGGSMKKNLHIDVVIRKPTITIDGHLILEKGKLCV